MLIIYATSLPNLKTLSPYEIGDMCISHIVMQSISKETLATRNRFRELPKFPKQNVKHMS